MLALRNSYFKTLGTLLFCALACVVSKGFAAPAPTPAPDAIIRDVSAKILVVLKDASSYYDKDPERLHQQLDALLLPIVNYDAIAKSVMASYYKQADDAQRKRFSLAFRQGLVKTYSRAMLRYAKAKMDLVPSDGSESRPDRASVKMQVAGGDGQVYPLEYSMGKDAAGAWRILNVVVNGINLGLTYRNQFAGEMAKPENKSSIDKVIDGWTSVAIKSAKESGAKP